jgi:hypothetical protein
MKTSANLALGTRTISHEIDIGPLPLGTVVEFVTEVSDDGGQTWRSHGGVGVTRGQEIVGRPCGAGVAFQNGNTNPNFRVRTLARIKDGPEILILMTEHIDRVI